MDPLHTIAEVVQYIEANYRNPKAFNVLEGQEWKHISSEEFIFNLKRLTFGLISLGLQKGDKVGLLADSSPYWNLADFATIIAGAISVPLFSKISHENFIYECAQANIRFLFVQGEGQWAMYNEHRSLFEKVISLDEQKKVDEAISFAEIMRLGEALWQKEPGLWDELILKANSDDICTIIYTAGSMGMPKGVQLTNKNLCHLISFDIFDLKASEKYLSILPLAHVFARQINLILIAWDVNVYYLNDLSQMAGVCREIQPSLMIVVPRILERMYSAIEGKIRHGKKNLKNVLSNWALNVADDPLNGFFKRTVFLPIADALVYSKMRKSLGESWRAILCGGAALDKALQQFFLNIGIQIYEGWGLTETSTVCVNFPNHRKVGTVGKPLPGVKVKLGENDELLVGGPTVMKGYYRNPHATESVIDKEGWLHTGDKGSIDKEGYVKIIGRVKEQFKLSSGEYLSPTRIEYMLCQHLIVDMALVIGEKRKYASCLLFVDHDALKRLKKEKKQESLSDEEFLHTPFVKEEMDKLLSKINSKINSWEKLVKYRFILEAPSIEGGDLTPTLKLKRDAILKKYHDVIEGIYGEEA